ncbi:MAG TPA: AbrB/MazE/SpoVT family DNA-binding domain-containing protein [Candidatus Lokiarchaeia archaeon]|nr:AbrB/MazE/SpoVT family DNA-binding domain-containing protein [Candidatus Lokiarchaeia archaeon]
METGKINSKGQVVIPKQLRDLAGLRTGDTVLFKINDNTTTIEKVDAAPLSIVNLLKKGNPFLKDLVKIIRDE